MEIWDLYSEDRKIIGQHIRGNELLDNTYHLVVHIWIKNSENKFLISQRSENRPTCPLMWECTGGSVLKGETSLAGAIREVREELGVDLNPEDGRLLFSKIRKIVNGKNFNDILDVWVFNYNGDIILEKAITDEVCDINWMDKKEILELYKKGELVNTLSYFFDVDF